MQRINLRKPFTTEQPVIYGAYIIMLRPICVHLTLIVKYTFGFLYE